MALHVLAYNLTRILNIVGIKPMMERSGRKAPTRFMSRAAMPFKFAGLSEGNAMLCGNSVKRLLAPYSRVLRARDVQTGTMVNAVDCQPASVF